MYYIKWYVLLSELKKIKSVEIIGNIGLEKKIKKLPTFTWHKRVTQNFLFSLQMKEKRGKIVTLEIALLFF